MNTSKTKIVGFFSKGKIRQKPVVVFFIIMEMLLFLNFRALL